MKKNTLLLITIFFVSCSRTIKNQYSGYIYCDSIPLKDVKIFEEYSNNYTYSNDKGYFILNRKNLSTVNNLIMVKEGKRDTIGLLRGAGSNLDYLFLYDVLDTLNLCQERIYIKQSRETTQKK